MKPVVRSAIRSARSRGVVGVIELDERKILAAADLGQRAGLFDRQVGHDRPGHARGLRVGHVSFQPVPKDDRVADHRDDRRLDWFTCRGRRPSALSRTQSGAAC